MNDYKALVLAMREGFEVHINFSDLVDTDRKPPLATCTAWDGCCCPTNSGC
jgi:hypothetical protein